MTAALIAKLESASEGSRELDALVEIAVRAVEAARTGLAKEHWAKWTVSRDFYVEDAHTAYRPEPVTTSIDAALALTERCLPGQGVGMTWLPKDQGAESSADVWFDLETDQVPRGSASTPALAICAALLRASAAEGAGHE